jgi:DNA-binding GntR family transcriptional regulator
VARPENASQSLTEAAYEALRSDILACRVPPGAKLNINEICDALSVSLSAVREALSRLTAEGLVVAEPHRGFRAAPVSADDLRDLTGTRVEIEGSCLRRAIALGDMDWEIGIVAAYHRLSRTRERVAGDEARVADEWTKAHKDFHASLVQACDSYWRLRLRGFLYDQTERYRQLSVPARREERNLADEHKAIMEATIARDADRAVALVEAHLTLTADRVAALAGRSDAFGAAADAADPSEGDFQQSLTRLTDHPKARSKAPRRGASRGRQSPPAAE